MNLNSSPCLPPSVVFLYHELHQTQGQSTPTCTTSLGLWARKKGTRLQTPIVVFLIFYYSFFQLNLQKREVGRWKALIAHAVCSSYETTEWVEWVCLQSLLLKIKLCLANVCKQCRLIAWVFQSSHSCVCFDIDANRQLTSPCISKPCFSPEADLWSLGPANGNKKKHRCNTLD